MPYATQCTTPAGARPSGSTTRMAKLLVSAGAFDHDRAGDTLSPIQFGLFLRLPTYFLSSTAPSLNDDDVIVNGSAAAMPQDAANRAQPNNASRPLPRCTNMISSRDTFCCSGSPTAPRAQSTCNREWSRPQAV